MRNLLGRAFVLCFVGDDCPSKVGEEGKVRADVIGWVGDGGDDESDKLSETLEFDVFDEQWQTDAVKVEAACFPFRVDDRPNEGHCSGDDDRGEHKREDGNETDSSNDANIVRVLHGEKEEDLVGNSETREKQ